MTPQEFAKTIAREEREWRESFVEEIEESAKQNGITVNFGAYKGKSESERAGEILALLKRVERANLNLTPEEKG